MLGGGALSSYSVFLKAALPLMLPTTAYAALYVRLGVICGRLSLGKESELTAQNAPLQRRSRELGKPIRDVHPNRHHLTQGLLQLSEKPNLPGDWGAVHSIKRGP